MRIQRALNWAGGIAGSLLVGAIAPAQAFTTFTTHFTGSDPKGDILLDSIGLPSGRVIDDFSFVSGANISSNDRWVGGDTGGASADRGDNATIGTIAQNPTNADIVAALGNRNLSSITDSEDAGSYSIDLAFAKPLDTLFFWERGGNSKLDVQALNAAGNPIGNLLTLSSNTWRSAGFSIDTTEIANAQPVSSLGVNTTDLGVSGAIAAIRVADRGASYNGADFKVVGARVPEPSMLAGLGLTAGLLMVARRRRDRV